MRSPRLPFRFVCSFVIKTLVALLFMVSFCAARHFQHVVIVVQENRTPDNLFSDCPIPGADVQHNGGKAVPLGGGKSPSLTHADFVSQAAGVWANGTNNYVRGSYIGPYCQLANQYAFANRMFQTNQGPSFPAHQFLFGGTSAPTANSDLFAAENPRGNGCLSGSSVAMIDPLGQENTLLPSCFERPTLSDELDEARLSWRYYAVYSLWNTPITISHICGKAKHKCAGADWSNVINNPPQVLADIGTCNLANVVWVTPAADYSDHPGLTNGTGPSWVASIVNAIGSNPKCADGETYWRNTAILVTWDDWGGWYDHVPPLTNYTGWCGSYCYGFRVPLLVISAYTPPMTDDISHDFGSILHFVESSFRLASLGYADAYADDLSNFFTGSVARHFQPVPAPPADFSDTREPDDN